MTTTASTRGWLPTVLATAAVTATVATLDLTWLGVVARGFYDSALGPLKRPEAFMPAACLFYALYTAAVVAYAVLGSAGLASAARRGAGLGFVAYGTYELTNWAVLRDWPPLIVPVDIVWGVALTTAAACAGRLVLEKSRR